MQALADQLIDNIENFVAGRPTNLDTRRLLIPHGAARIASVAFEFAQSPPPLNEQASISLRCATLRVIRGSGMDSGTDCISMQHSARASAHARLRALMCAVAFVAGCGGGGDDAPAASPTPSASPAPTPSASPAPPPSASPAPIPSPTPAPAPNRLPHRRRSPRPSLHRSPLPGLHRSLPPNLRRSLLLDPPRSRRRLPPRTCAGSRARTCAVRLRLRPPCHRCPSRARSPARAHPTGRTGLGPRPPRSTDGHACRRLRRSRTTTRT